MVNRKKKRTKEKARSEKPKEDETARDKTVHANEFGGLPERDLKKNLGCG